MTVADQFACEQQHRDFVPVPQTHCRILVYVDHIHRISGGLRQRRQGQEHLLAQSAVRPRVQQEPQWDGSGPLDDLTE